MSGYVTTGNYEVVEFLEGTGTQYFDTGFIPNQDTRVRFKIKIQTLENEHWGFFGAGQSYDSRAFECYTWKSSQGNTPLEFNYNNNYQFGDDVHVGDVVEIDFNKNVVKYKINDGVEKTITFTYANFSAPHSMYIFSTHRPTQEIYPISCTFADIYYVEIYDNGTLIRNYKPVQDEHDTLGLYDEVNETFSVNSGTGTFTPGDPTGEWVDLEVSTRLKVNASKDITQLDYDLAECEEGWFSKYTRVEYITQNGTGARIDTGIQFKDIGYMDLDFQYDVANFTCVCGGATGAGNNYVCWYSNQLHEGRGGNVIDSGNDKIIGHRYRFISKQGTNTSIAYRDGEFLKNYTSYLFSNSTAIMGLFAFGDGGYAGGTQRIYHAEFRRSEDGEVLRKFIPCIRKSDSKSGMYDMVTKQFFEGIGETFYPSSKEYHFDYQKYHMYCARPIYQIDIDIADKIDGWFGEYIRCDYIESTSQQYIDTGINITGSNTEINLDMIIVNLSHSEGNIPFFFGAGSPWTSLQTTQNRGQFEYDIYNTTYYPGVNIETDKRYKFKYSLKDTNAKVYLNDELIGNHQVTPRDCSRTVYVFGRHSSDGSAGYLSSMKLYRFDMTVRGQLVRDFIPCIRRSDMKAGLYDLVGCQFYYSSNGYDLIPGGNQYEFNYIKY